MVVKGDVDSVLRIGPVELQRRGDWQQRDSDLFAHFIQVSGQISRSSWRSSPNRFSRSAGHITHSEFPAIEDFVYVAVYFRQLFGRSKSDQLFKAVCSRYDHFCQHREKVAWVTEELGGFTRTLAGPSFMLSEYTTEELIEAFMYGASILHGMPREKNKETFHRIIGSHPREEVLFALNSGLHTLQSHASRVAAVLHQDLGSWIHTYNLPAPDVLWHNNLFDTPTSRRDS